MTTNKQVPLGPVLQPELDKALAEHLDELTTIANEIGADGIWLVRGVKEATLTYTPTQGVAMPDIPGVKVNLDLSLKLAEASSRGAGVLVVIRFPTSDGREVGIEKR
jgi:hypothetical protein